MRVATLEVRVLILGAEDLDLTFLLIDGVVLEIRLLLYLRDEILVRVPGHFADAFEMCRRLQPR